MNGVRNGRASNDGQQRLLPPVICEGPEALEEHIDDWIIEPSAKLANAFERQRSCLHSQAKI